MKNFNKILLNVLFIANILNAAPALQKWKIYKQKNGEELKLKLQGDEYFHSYKTEDNNDIKYNKKTENFEDYDIKNNKIIFASVPYKVNKNIKHLPNIEKEIKKINYHNYIKKSFLLKK